MVGWGFWFFTKCLLRNTLVYIHIYVCEYKRYCTELERKHEMYEYVSNCMQYVLCSPTWGCIWSVFSTLYLGHTWYIACLGSFCVYIWHTVSLRAQIIPEKVKLSRPINDVKKSEMNLFWCISITSNMKTCKKFNERAQTANFSVLKGGYRKIFLFFHRSCWT